MFRIFCIGAFITLICFACTNQAKDDEKIAVARVHEKYLYDTDLDGLFNEDMSIEDSLQIVNSYIDKWIRKQLILEKAELNLSINQKDVERQLDDYKSSLLIFKYEQQWIKQNLDTVVSNNETREYYNLYSSNFVLDEDIVKAVFIKVPSIAPNLDKVKKWYKSDKKEDYDNLESYCFEFAKNFDSFDDDWISFNVLIRQIPFDIANKERFLKRNRYIEAEDSLYNYFINIRNYKIHGEIAPLSYVEENIKQIIINKRKLQLIRDLEKNIYNDGLNYGHFEKYN